MRNENDIDMANGAVVIHLPDSIPEEMSSEQVAELRKIPAEI